jgi:Tfp pilus assembly protein PilO
VNRLERRWVLALGVVLGLNLAAYLVYTLPRSLQQRNLAARKQVLQGETELERQRVAAVREVSDAIDANTKDTQRFFKDVVGSRRPGLVASLRSIEELASAQGLKVGAQGYKSEAVEDLALERLEVSMPVEGSYRQLVAFLQGLERHTGQFLTLDQIVVRGTEGGQAKLELVLSCYFRGTEESSS